MQRVGTQPKESQQELRVRPLTQLLTAEPYDEAAVVGFLQESPEILNQKIGQFGLIAHFAQAYPQEPVVSRLLAAMPALSSHIELEEDFGFEIVARDIDDNDTNLLFRGALHCAAQVGNVDAVKALLDHKVGDDTDDAGNTALHVAVLQGQVEVVRLLLAAEGFDACAKNKAGDTALHLVCHREYDDTAKALFQAFAQGKSIEKYKGQFNAQGDTAMGMLIRESSLAAVKEMPKELYFLNLSIIFYFAENTHKDSGDKFKWFLRIRYPHLNFLKCKLEGKSCFDVALANGNWPFIEACLGKVKDTKDGFNELLETVNLSQVYFEIKIGTHLNVQNLFKDISIRSKSFENIFGYVDENGNTMLHLAVSIGDVPFVKNILRVGYPYPRAKNKDGNTALHLVCHREYDEKAKALFQAFAQGKSIEKYNDQPNAQGDTAMGILIRESSLAAVKEMPKGLNSLNFRIIFYFAENTHQDSRDKFKWFLEADYPHLDFLKRELKGKSCFDVALEHGNWSFICIILQCVGNDWEILYRFFDAVANWRHDWTSKSNDSMQQSNDGLIYNGLRDFGESDCLSWAVRQGSPHALVLMQLSRDKKSFGHYNENNSEVRAKVSNLFKLGMESKHEQVRLKAAELLRSYMDRVRGMEVGLTERFSKYIREDTVNIALLSMDKNIFNNYLKVKMRDNVYASDFAASMKQCATFAESGLFEDTAEDIRFKLERLQWLVENISLTFKEGGYVSNGVHPNISLDKIKESILRLKQQATYASQSGETAEDNVSVPAVPDVPVAEDTMETAASFTMTEYKPGITTADDSSAAMEVTSSTMVTPGEAEEHIRAPVELASTSKDECRKQQAQPTAPPGPGIIIQSTVKPTAPPSYNPASTVGSLFAANGDESSESCALAQALVVADKVVRDSATVTITPEKLHAMSPQARQALISQLEMLSRNLETLKGAVELGDEIEAQGEVESTSVPGPIPRRSEH